MKTFFALLTVCLIASTMADIELNQELKAKVKSYFQECVKKENISEEDVNKLRKRNFSHPSDGLKCFTACFFEVAGAVKDGKVQEEYVLKELGALIGDEKAKEVLNKCKKVKGKDRCDTGLQMYECVASFKLV